jgi:hypothetical protein
MTSVRKFIFFNFGLTFVFVITNQKMYFRLIKNSMKRSISFTGKFVAMAVMVILFSQCGGTRNVSINALQPAAITFPAYVNTIVIVDRTRYEHRRDEIIHDIFSGGIPGEDRAAVQAAISSLNTTLQLSPRFKVLTATEVFRGNSLTNAFPDAMPWDEITSICSEYKADAVISFEIFGSNFVITNGNRIVKKQEKDDKGKTYDRDYTEYYAHGIGSIRMGIRLYDPKGMTIIDQQLFTNTHTWDATGNSIQDALMHLVAKSEATRYVATNAARDYAYKIAPMPIRLNREFYAKSKKVPEMETGTRQADVNDWNGALTTWQNALNNNPPPKQAGQLCFNIAVAYEVLGNLEEAKKWAAKSYVDYGNKNARNYSNILNNREADEQRVNDQMK